MQPLTRTVGDGGANARHDVALVQAILVHTQRPANLDVRRPTYLKGGIDGTCGNITKQAIRQFQTDQVFVGPSGNTSQLVPIAIPGRVAPGDITWTKLVAVVQEPFKDLRVLNGSKTVYVAATPAQRGVSIAAALNLTFQPAFRTNVIAVIRRLYDTQGIACSVCQNGDRRTFQTQYDIYTSKQNVRHGITNAGPGESNHNFGQAVDLGFKGLRWLRQNGTTVENEDWWLHQLDPAQQARDEALVFWNALRTAGTQAGLFRGPERDRPHLQAWSDAGVDMANRLAGLLTRSGRMRWTGGYKKYQCDLGFGGHFYDVGSADQIWSGQSTITEATLTKARAQGRGQTTAAGTPPGTVGSGIAAARGGTTANTPPAAPAATAQDVGAMRDALRADFDAADAAWQSWLPH